VSTSRPPELEEALTFLALAGGPAPDRGTPSGTIQGIYGVDRLERAWAPVGP
jgi:hypothetical protein